MRIDGMFSIKEFGRREREKFDPRQENRKYGGREMYAPLSEYG